MQKNIILLAILMVLSAGAYFLYQKSIVNRKMSSIKEEREFTVGSPDLIHKIVLKRVNQEPLVFEKKGKNNWLLNGKYKADEVVVGYMIQVLTNAKMKSIPSRNALEYIHQAIKNRGIVVEVYDANDDVLKKFSIGSDVQNGDATYMVMNGFEQAYAMELPALGGSLRSRFEQPLDKYRDKYIYREPVASIKSVKVEYHNDKNNSYVIEKKGGAYEITPVDKAVAKNTKSPDQNKIKTYLGFFEELGAELLYNHYEKKDSVLSLTPFCTITLVNESNEVKKYDYWDYDKIVKSTVSKERSADAIHINRFFVFTGDLYTVQTQVFGKIFASYPAFF
ncbi:MAG: DUF4340 domain-containing protein [Saprospiraceae bacterium]|nr:DUF4340 domain-containing protein [Saprospiraceae bacterium]MBK8855607.1 DUF4340 domain-containing protein [Saprospiraceae bacterium]MBP6695608.1 DUF4340 domain-containing protein [Saprospiraceae bacterium]